MYDFWTKNVHNSLISLWNAHVQIIPASRNIVDENSASKIFADEIIASIIFGAEKYA